MQANKAQELTKEIEELTKEIITKKKIGWEEKQKAGSSCAFSKACSCSIGILEGLV